MTGVTTSSRLVTGWAPNKQTYYTADSMLGS